MNKEYFGLLEPRLEGDRIIFSLYIGNFLRKEWNYEYLIEIKIGDFLNILSKDRKILWSGEIESLMQLKSLENFFNNQYFAILIKKQ